MFRQSIKVNLRSSFFLVKVKNLIWQGLVSCKGLWVGRGMCASLLGCIAVLIHQRVVHNTEATQVRLQHTTWRKYDVNP